MPTSFLLAIALASAPSTALEQEHAVHVKPIVAAGLSGAVVLPALGMSVVLVAFPPNGVLTGLMLATGVSMCFVGAGQMADGEFGRGALITFGPLFVIPAGVLLGFGLTPFLPPLGSRFGQPARTVDSSFFLGLSIAALGLAAYGTWSARDAYTLGVQNEVAEAKGR